MVLFSQFVKFLFYFCLRCLLRNTQKFIEVFLGSTKSEEIPKHFTIIYFRFLLMSRSLDEEYDFLFKIVLIGNCHV